MHLMHLQVQQLPISQTVYDQNPNLSNIPFALALILKIKSGHNFAHIPTDMRKIMTWPGHYFCKFEQNMFWQVLD